MNDHIDDGGAGRLDDGQEDLFDLDAEPEEFDEIDKAHRREQLQWLADRGLCSWSEAIETSTATRAGDRREALKNAVAAFPSLSTTHS
jgi:hypothetical protein